MNIELWVVVAGRLSVCGEARPPSPGDCNREGMEMYSMARGGGVVVREYVCSVSFIKLVEVVCIARHVAICGSLVGAG